MSADNRVKSLARDGRWDGGYLARRPDGHTVSAKVLPTVKGKDGDRVAAPGWCWVATASAVEVVEPPRGKPAQKGG